MKAAGLCVAVLIILIISEDVISYPLDLKSLQYVIEPDDVRKLFFLLRDYGQVHLNNFKNEHTEFAESLSQYMVAAVLSDIEIYESKDWDTLPANVLGQRIYFFLNERDKNWQELLKGKKAAIHGEIQFLLTKSTIFSGMMNSLRSEYEGTFPFVFLYSYYIPCANVNTVPYSCSEELAAASLASLDEFKMLIGYTEVYTETDLDRSRDFMRSGFIDLFNVADNVVREYELPSSINVEHNFQELLYECLDQKPVSQCCTYMPGREVDKARILSFFINSLVYRCTVNQQHSATLTKVTRTILYSCITNDIQNNVGGDCNFCDGAYARFAISYCSLHAEAFASHIGTPAEIGDPYIPIWVYKIGHWGDLYRGFVDDEAQYPSFYCAKGTNDLKGLCTKLIKDNQHIKSGREFADVSERVRQLKKQITDRKPK